jgi:superfamily II DNA helicase RecQ
VRFVFHYHISSSLDAYYQEIGRAGRDGHGARALLFYRPEDLHLRRFFAGCGQGDRAHFEGLLPTAGNRPALSLWGWHGFCPPLVKRW